MPLFCHQSDCCREKAVKESSFLGGDTVRPAVSQVVRAVFVSEK